MGLEGGEGVEGAGGGGSDEGFYHVVEVGLHSVGGLAMSWTGRLRGRGVLRLAFYSAGRGEATHGVLGAAEIGVAAGDHAFYIGAFPERGDGWLYGGLCLLGARYCVRRRARGGGGGGGRYAHRPRVFVRAMHWVCGRAKAKGVER